MTTTLGVNVKFIGQVPVLDCVDEVDVLGLETEVDVCVERKNVLVNWVSVVRLVVVDPAGSVDEPELEETEPVLEGTIELVDAGVPEKPVPFWLLVR